MKKTAIAIGLTLLLIAAFCAACSPEAVGEDEGSPASDKEPSEVSQSEAGQGWEYSFDAVGLYGSENVTDEALSENALVMMNFWATWCPPCVDELPELQKLQEAYAPKGVKIVGVVIDGVNGALVKDLAAIEAGKTLLTDANASYSQVLPDETMMRDFISTMQAVPTTYFFNAKGEIVEMQVGSNTFEGWSELIDSLLEKAGQ